VPQRHLSPFRRRVRFIAGRPRHPRFADREIRYRPNRLLGLAYAVRRPFICYGCICLTRAERQRQERVFALVRAIDHAQKTGTL